MSTTYNAAAVFGCRVPIERIRVDTPPHTHCAKCLEPRTPSTARYCHACGREYPIVTPRTLLYDTKFEHTLRAKGVSRYGHTYDSMTHVVFGLEKYARHLDNPNVELCIPFWDTTDPNSDRICVETRRALDPLNLWVCDTFGLWLVTWCS